jgi:spoIIIJ-associated protein
VSEPAGGGPTGDPPDAPSGEGAQELEVEATGETVGEAKWSALRELERLAPGLDKSAVRVQVLTEGQRGLLGVGFAPARVLASVAVDAAPERDSGGESPLAEDVRMLVEAIAAGLGVSCRVDVQERESEVVASFAGRDLGMLIGRHGQTIDAAQYLVNAIVARSWGDARKEVVVDASGYRSRRRATLEGIAARAAERARATGEPVVLEPMSAVERKVVHLALRDVSGIETTSEGTEPSRHVVVAPARE